MGFSRFAVLTAISSLLVVAVGGAVRATDSGLACPDWPRCFGLWIPPADLNIWLEHSHRLLAGVVGLMILGLALWALARFRGRRGIVWPAVAALVLVVAQSALGALVVLQLLRAELVTAHLGMAMIVVACCVLVAVNASSPSRPEPGARDRRFAVAAAAVAGLAYVQILVGGHVTGIGAGLVWTEFPLMDGAVVPAIGTQQEAFHFAHRALAFLLVGATIWLAWAAVAHRRARLAIGQWADRDHWLVRLAMWAATLVLVQVGLGVANLWTNASYVTVIPHLAVASWIWTVLFLLAVLAYRQAPVRAGSLLETR